MRVGGRDDFDEQLREFDLETDGLPADEDMWGGDVSASSGGQISARDGVRGGEEEKLRDVEVGG